MEMEPNIRLSKSESMRNSIITRVCEYENMKSAKNRTNNFFFIPSVIQNVYLGR